MVWLVFQEAGEKYVYIDERDLLMARLKASMAGHTEGFVECHKLDAKMSKRIPKAAIRRRLSNDEAMRLLQKIG
jgi:hypothetical protein